MIVDYDKCPVCGEDLKEELGDGDNFECDVIGYRAHTHHEED